MQPNLIIWNKPTPPVNLRNMDRGQVLKSPVVPQDLEFSSRRSPVLGTLAAVATSQPAATFAGVGILQKGGNATDAAVAISAVLCVVEPCSTGIGGDCFLLHYSKATGAVTGLNGSGRAPQALDLETALADVPPGRKSLPPWHGHTVTVPGAAAGWCDAVDKWGSGNLSLAEILEPAIQLAERGFPVAPITAYHWAEGVKQLKKAVGGGGSLLNADGKSPACGEIHYNPDMAKVLRELASKGKEGFYKGWVAEGIVKSVREAGGVMTLEDMASHTSTFPDPISVDFNGVRVYEVPPNGQGITALLALNILSHMHRRQWHEASESERIHAQIEALRLAFADTRYYCADPDVVSVPVHELLSDEYAKERAKVYDSERATADIKHGCPVTSTNTVSFQVVDEHGDAVSFVNSNYIGFGSGIVPEGMGFPLQNRGLGFTLEKGHPNCVQGGKRPYHTIIPCMCTDARTGELYASLSNMGAYMQPQGHVQLLCNLVEGGMDPQTSIDRPRFCILDGTANGEISVEDSMKPSVIEELRAKGHKIKVISGNDRYIFGRAQIILRAATDVLWCGSDGRCDGSAVAF